MIGCSKKNKENYPPSHLNKRIRKVRLKFNPGLQLIRLQALEPKVLVYNGTFTLHCCVILFLYNCRSKVISKFCKNNNLYNFLAAKYI